MTTFKFFSKLSGTSFEGRQDKINKLVEGEVLTLEGEPTNKFDANAIKVISKEQGMLGYIPKDTAAKIVEDVKNNSVVCKVSQITGGNGLSYGCNIELEIVRA
jgi:hypothetical protein